MLARSSVFMSSLLVLFTWIANASFAAEPLPCVLELRNGDFVRGTLASIDEDKVEWRSPHFVGPLVFPKSQVEGMKYAPSEDRERPDGDFLIELANRDTLYADLDSIDDMFVVINSPSFGPAKLRRNLVRRLSRNGPDLKIYPVPCRLDDWQVSDANHWRNEGGAFVTEDKMATLFADVNLPSKAALELDFSWAKSPKNSTKPSFSIYFGTDETVPSRSKAFSIEVWETFAIVQRQLKDDADLASLADVTEVGSMRVFAYLDQEEDRLIMYDASGKLLADLTVPGNGDGQSGLMFLNRSGMFRLNYLQVRSWTGTKPTDVPGSPFIVTTKERAMGGASLQLSDGKISVSAQNERSKAGDEQTTEDVAPVVISLKEVQRIDLPPPKVPDESGPSFVASFHDGSRISGELVSATDLLTTVRIEASEDLLELPIHRLRGFALSQVDAKESMVRSAPKGFRFGKLEMMDTRLRGWLVESEVNSPNAACLTWKPAMATNSSALNTNVFGRIVYRVPPKPKQVAVRGVERGRFVIRGGFVGMQQNNVSKKRTAPTKLARAVHLRSGDVIPCDVVKIDERGVHIKSAMTDSKLLRHEQVKAAQLVQNAPLPSLIETKRERLLTLPRMQKNSPPSHLLFSLKGDVLRGTLLSLTDRELQMEVRLNPHLIPRDRIATIIWLHEDEIDSDAPLKDAQAAEVDGQKENRQKDDSLMVQVVRNSGTRYSFYAESFSDQTLHGSSEVLKTMHAKVSEIDQLLIGGFIESAAKTLMFGRWHLSPATDPKFVTAGEESGDEGNTIPGTESLLVGKPAPQIKLKMLDEQTEFRLADHQGHCVVLDFWATWCGPCLQVMPIVEEVVAEFEHKDVKLFAVNLEERPAEIKATLERRQLDIAVALDRDGVAAARYEATAIPQTVVIAPDGTVARVFVGSSRKFADQLRAALTELTE